MPLILPREKILEWLDPANEADRLKEYAVKEMQALPAER